jgi:hypothetical protein
MHRSGTSLVAGAIRLLGVSLGDPNKLSPPGPDNPAGYWEVRSIKELDDEVLAEMGGAWDHPPVLAPGWERGAALDQFRERASRLLDEVFGRREERAPIVAWKDPRLSLLLPFWATVTPISHSIVVIRDPREVAASLADRNGMEPSQTALLWLRYLFASRAAGHAQLVVRHRDLFDDLPAVLAAISVFLDLPTPDSATEVAVREHLQPSLYHHVALAERPPAENPVVAMADLVWNGGEVAFDLLPEAVADALAQGWLRPPADGEALAQARAKIVKQQETIKRRARKAAAAAEARRSGGGGTSTSGSSSPAAVGGPLPVNATEARP